VTEGNGGERVSYTTKELLERLDKKLDSIVEELHRKADKVALDALSLRLRSLEDLTAPGLIAERLAEFEVVKKTVLDHGIQISKMNGLSAYRRWAIPVGLTLANLGLGVFALMRT
jgi:hypothetical protein